MLFIYISNSVPAPPSGGLICELLFNHANNENFEFYQNRLIKSNFVNNSTPEPSGCTFENFIEFSSFPVVCVAKFHM